MSMGVSGDSISRERGSRRAKCTTVVEAGRGLAGAAVPSACASSSCASDQGSACSVLSGRHERRSGLLEVPVSTCEPGLLPLYDSLLMRVGSDW
jgi:hypothetical protein